MNDHQTTMNPNLTDKEINIKKKVVRKISIIDETIKVSNRIKKDPKPKNKFRLRKTMVNDKLLKNYFVFENSTRAENELTTYRIDRENNVEKQIVASQIQVATRNSIMTTVDSPLNNEYQPVNPRNDPLIEDFHDHRQENLMLLLLLINSISRNNNRHF